MQDPEDTKPLPDQRVDWIDAARGAAITLVVFGHTWRGLFKAGLIPEPLFAAVDARIYAFHMPVFFAIAGWFFVPLLAKTPVGGFVKTRLLRLLWPTVLWTYLFLAIKLLAGEHANTPTALTDLLVLPIPGQLHLWFLWALFVMSLAFCLLKPFSAGGRLPVAVLCVTGLIVLAGYVWWPPPAVRHWVGPALSHAPFLLLGIAMAQYRVLPGLASGTRRAALGIFALLLVFWPQIAEGPFELAGKLMLTICFLAVLSATESAPDSRLSRQLCRLGAAAMAIFLMHTIFSAALRAALISAGIDDLALHLILGTGIGIIGPLVGFWVARRLGLARLLGF